jgi:ferredoxin--NADP+ reductase
MNVVEIIGNTEIARNAFILEFDRFFDFQPGQVISLAINGHAPRMYSIASGNTDKTVKILYDIKPDGEVTPLLKNLNRGDTIKVSEPVGKFFSDKEAGFWIANGTGIAPFYSMFRSGLGERKTVIHGGRIRDIFYFQDEFEAYFKDRYVRCASRDEGPGLYSGRLTKYLREQKHLPPDQKYYLCGSPEMVVEVRDILISKHIPYNNIVAEIYF